MTHKIERTAGMQPGATAVSFHLAIPRPRVVGNGVFQGKDPDRIFFDENDVDEDYAFEKDTDLRPRLGFLSC